MEKSFVTIISLIHFGVVSYDRLLRDEKDNLL